MTYMLSLEWQHFQGQKIKVIFTASFVCSVGPSHIICHDRMKLRARNGGVGRKAEVGRTSLFVRDEHSI